MNPCFGRFMSSMKLSLLFFLFSITNAERIHVHLQPEVVIADYHGPLHKDVLQLFKGAETLEIINSNITKVHGHMVSNLPKLKKMIFINCSVDINEADFDNLFHGAVNLKEFICRHIHAKSLHPECLRTTPLEVFVMTDNVFKTFPADLLNQTMLKKMELCRNQLETIEEGAFNGLDKLEILDLDTNKLKNIPKIVLTPLKSLKKIKLRENIFERFSTEELPELPNLEYIDLGYNPLKELKLETVETVAPKLKTIDITGTSLPSTKIEELKTKHPNILLKTE